MTTQTFIITNEFTKGATANFTQWSKLYNSKLVEFNLKDANWFVNHCDLFMAEQMVNLINSGINIRIEFKESFTPMEGSRLDEITIVTPEEFLKMFHSCFEFSYQGKRESGDTWDDCCYPCTGDGNYHNRYKYWERGEDLTKWKETDRFVQTENGSKCDLVDNEKRIARMNQDGNFELKIVKR